MPHIHSRAASPAAWMISNEGLALAVSISNLTRHSGTSAKRPEQVRRRFQHPLHKLPEADVHVGRLQESAVFEASSPSSPNISRQKSNFGALRRHQRDVKIL